MIHVIKSRVLIVEKKLTPEAAIFLNDYISQCYPDTYDIKKDSTYYNVKVNSESYYDKAFI